MRGYLFVFLTLALKLFSQADSVQAPGAIENHISICYDNDFFSATDRYYTQGIQVNVIHPAIKNSPLSLALLRLRNSHFKYYGLHLEQDVFTPISIRHPGIFYGERPFTAVFFVSHSLTSIHAQKHVLLCSSLDLGIMGPAAKGEEEQKAIHKALVNIQPLGWENQLANNPVINYNLTFEKGILNKRHMELMATGILRAGTLYNDAGTGLHVRLGFFNPYFNRPGAENKHKNKFRICLIAKALIRTVVYNATLQGGIISTNIYTLPAADVSRLVATCQGGIAIVFKQLKMEYSKFYITPEFKRGVDHGWGRCVLTVSF